MIYETGARSYIVARKPIGSSMSEMKNNHIATQRVVRSINKMPHMRGVLIAPTDNRKQFLAVAEIYENRS